MIFCECLNLECIDWPILRFQSWCLGSRRPRCIWPAGLELCAEPWIAAGSGVPTVRWAAAKCWNEAITHRFAPNVNFGQDQVCFWHVPSHFPLFGATEKTPTTSPAANCVLGSWRRPWLLIAGHLWRAQMSPRWLLQNFSYCSRPECSYVATQKIKKWLRFSRLFFFVPVAARSAHPQEQYALLHLAIQLSVVRRRIWKVWIPQAALKEPQHRRTNQMHQEKADFWRHFEKADGKCGKWKSQNYQTGRVSLVWPGH